MYRSKKSTENSISSEIDDQIYEENKENVDQSKATNNDSISEMFKKLSINDRRRSTLSTIVKDGFMTSSPIQQSKLAKPIFTKIEEAVPSNICVISQQNYDVFTKIEEAVPSNICVISQQNNDEAILRSQTMKLSQKPPHIPNRNLVIKKESVDLKTNLSTKNISMNRSNLSLIAHKSTIPKPFSFENKDKALIENRKKLLEDDILEKKRLANAFRANPMPISSPVFIERKPMKSSCAASKTKILINDLNTSCNNPNSYKTKDLSYLHKSPVKLKPSAVPLTCPETPHLMLPKRLERRKMFDENQNIREQLYLQMKETIDLENLEKEKEEIRRLRCENIIKANPIRIFKNIKIEHSTKTTIPFTPKFSDRFKK